MVDTSVDIRCYCHGLGDCILLRLPSEVDGRDFWMLVDCGVHTSQKEGPRLVREVTADVAEVTGGHIDVVVGTHEHWDHLSGFLQAAEIFAKVTVGEVWFSWAEDPVDPDARRLDRYKADAAMALAGASLSLADSPGMKDVAVGTAALLGFVFGAKGEKVRDAREALRGLASRGVRHLQPGTVAPLKGASGVRCYVLGPPRDERLLGIEDVVSETYAFGGSPLSVAPLANGLAVNGGALRVDDDPAAPFDGSVGADWSRLSAGEWSTDPDSAPFAWSRYFSPLDDDGLEQDWRRVDQDWLASSVDLALQLDGRTNNTSLVLALEIVDSGNVILLAADAQIGSWQSWQSVVFPTSSGETARTGADLVARTVFYKVGHHGSRNATRSFELEHMDHANLVAFSPTDAAMAKKVKWKDFPAPKTAERLEEITSGRFVQGDAEWLRGKGQMPAVDGGALLAPMRSWLSELPEGSEVPEEGAARWVEFKVR
ncbi:MBL fold metallo-hydrolase [Sphingomonas sp. CFBP 13733]|uniref:MBL fold metallo-hydrolase n=1 Tax=Sphingomonas sp. CFBP 13733 TaxID=2775291 RepID=UPI00177F07C7|nr:MBL fold metallo-hydrolase [Sphingomonas sp. CFBP 13733]MBD8640281.1 MBL fold metallo-hydrolase [Sphingomonas sp. CFBP 13733]